MAKKLKRVATYDDLVFALEMTVPALEWCVKQWENTPQRGDAVLRIVRAVLSEVPDKRAA